MPNIIKHQFSVVGVIHVDPNIIVGGAVAGREASIAGQQRDLGVIALFHRGQLDGQLGGILARLNGPVVGLVVINPAANFFPILKRSGSIITGISATLGINCLNVLGLTAHDLDVPTDKHRLDISIRIIKADTVIPNFKHPVAHGPFTVQDV